MQKNQENIFSDETIKKIERESYEYKVIQDKKLIDIIKSVVEKDPEFSKHAYAHSFLTEIFHEYYDMEKINKFNNKEKYYELVDKVLIIYGHKDTENIFYIGGKKIHLDENELCGALDDHKQAA